MVNVERIKQKLDEFVRKQQEWELAHPEEAKRLKEEKIQERIEEERAQRSFWGGQETAEEEEWKMIAGLLDEIGKPTPEQQAIVDDWKGSECEDDLR